jgi:GNAT superfamily N-acetyltransferase
MKNKVDLNTSNTSSFQAIAVGDDGNAVDESKEESGDGRLALDTSGIIDGGGAGRVYLESVYRGSKCGRRLRRESLELAKEMVCICMCVLMGVYVCIYCS